MIRGDQEVFDMDYVVWLIPNLHIEVNIESDRSIRMVCDVGIRLVSCQTKEHHRAVVSTVCSPHASRVHLFIEEKLLK